MTNRVVRVFTDLGAVQQTTQEMLDASVCLNGMNVLNRLAYPFFINASTKRASRYFLRLSRGELSVELERLIESLESGECSREAGLQQLDQMLTNAPTAIRLGTPLRVLIAGRPNVGKSTLFNSLFGLERVVVSSTPGTTRDLVLKGVCYAHQLTEKQDDLTEKQR